MPIHPARPHHSLELLESRVVPAGNLLVNFANGLLTITAESPGEAEAFQLKSLTQQGDYERTEQILLTPTDGATTFNGLAAFATSFGEIVRDIRVNLKAGDDALSITNLQLPGKVDVQLGEGENSIFIDGDTHITGSLAIKSGAGDDSVRLVNGVSVGKGLTISAGAGTNDLHLLFGVAVGGALKITTGAGDDTVRFGNLQVTGATTVKLGSGKNTLGSDVSDAGITRLQGAAKFTFGSGVDTFALPAGSIFGGTFTATMGAGFNTVTLEAFSIQRAVTIQGGAEQDVVRVSDGTFGSSFKVAFGNGQNQLAIDGVTEQLNSDPSNVLTSTVGTTILGALKVTSGSSSDRIEIGDEQRVQIFGATSIATGTEPGGDLIQIDDASFYGKCTLKTGGGNDTVNLDFKGSSNGTVLFTDKVTILFGAGGDTLRLGNAGSAQSGVYFALRPLLNGGVGDNDNFDSQDYSFDGGNGDLKQKGFEA